MKTMISGFLQDVIIMLFIHIFPIHLLNQITEKSVFTDGFSLRLLAGHNLLILTQLLRNCPLVEPDGQMYFL